MDPFSHIKVVHRQREEEPEDDARSPQMVFRRPSFSQQVQHAAMPGLQPGVSVRGGGSSSRASLANLTSGTTFAAAARQAELNAARASRQKAREAEKLDKANEVPAIEPVALGTLKFTTSRRGYVVSDPDLFHWFLWCRCNIFLHDEGMCEMSLCFDIKGL